MAVDLWGEPVPHALLLHQKAKGLIALCHRAPGWRQEFAAAQALPAAVAAAKGLPEWFISQNTFTHAVRVSAALCQLRALWVDIDCYRLGLKADEALARVEARARAKELPWPSAAVFSGRGVAALWLLKPTPATARPRWEAVEAALIDALRGLGADAAARDPSRVLRLAGSVNAKNGAIVRVLEYREPGRRGATRYELADLARDYLPEDWHTSARGPRRARAPADGRRREPDGSTKRTFTWETLHEARMRDLLRLGDLREWKCQGMREVMVFLFRYWNCCRLRDPEEALENAKGFNGYFEEPLSDKEVTSATRSAEKAWKASQKALADGRAVPGKPGQPLDGYHYSNERLIELLEITADEQRHLETIISAEEKRRRWNERRHQGRWRQVPMREREERLQVVLEARPAASQRALAEDLGWSQTTVHRTLRQTDSKDGNPRAGRQSMRERTARLQAAIEAHPSASERWLARDLGWSRDTVQRVLKALAESEEGG